MSIQKVFNGTTYSIPERGDSNFGDELSAFFSDVADSAVTITGTQTLLNKTLNGAVITGTTINGSVIGALTPAAGSFTAINANTATIGGNAVATVDRMISTGAGLTGGGNLTADRTLSLSGQALAFHSLASDGLVVRAGGTVTARAITGTGNRIVVTNGTGTTGNPTVDIGSDVVTVSRSISTGAGLAGGGDLSANLSLSLTGQAAAFHNLATDGLVARSGETVTARTITGTAGRIVVTNGDGLAGAPTLDIGSDVVTVSRSIATGTGLTGGGNLTADRTLSLSGQALAFHSLATDGLVVRSGGTVSARTLTGTGNRIVVTNGTGTAGNPTLDVGSDVVTLAGAQTLTGKTLSGPTITGAAISGGTITGISVSGSTINGLTLPSAAGASGQILMSNGSGGVVWGNSAGTGTVTNVQAGAGLTGGTITSAGTIALATSGVAAGTYSAPSITVDQYGRITAAATATGASFSDMVWNSHVAGSAFASSWAEMGSVGGGQGWFGSNLYNTGSAWKTRATHASIGARALTFNAPSWGDVSIAEVPGATTAGGTVTPTFRTLWHSGNFDPATKAGLGSNTFSGQTLALGSGTYLPASTSISQASGAVPNNTGSLVVQSQGTGATAGAAFMSFHRPGTYAVHLGLDTDNKLKVGGWSMGNVAYTIWHTGNLTPDTAPNPNTTASRTPDGSLLGNHLYARSSDTSSNGVTLVALGSNSDALDAYFQMNSSTNTTAPAGARGLALVVNTGGFGLYTGRLSPSPVYVMDQTTKTVSFHRATSSVPVTAAFGGTVTLDFAASNRFDLTATGSFTLSNPSNIKPGQTIILNITHAANNVVMSLGSYFKTAGGVGVTLSTDSGARDKIIMECVNSTTIDISIKRDWK